MIFKSKICLTNRGELSIINIKEGDRGVAAPVYGLITAYGCELEAVIFITLLLFFIVFKITKSKNQSCNNIY